MGPDGRGLTPQQQAMQQAAMGQLTPQQQAQLQLTPGIALPHTDCARTIRALILTGASYSQTAMAKGAFPLAAPTPNLANFVQPHQVYGAQRRLLPAPLMLGRTKTLRSSKKFGPIYSSIDYLFVLFS